jgi:beta-lactamase regulating signal transducer with metallopeptidase domain
MSDSFPHFAGILASYFLRVAAAYAVCWLLSRLSPSPRRRFVVWLFFLLGAAGYWIGVVLPSPVQLSVSRAVGTLPLHQAAVAPHTLLFPATWAPALALVAPIVAAAYLMGVLLFLANMLWQHLVLRRALRHAIEPSRDLALLFGAMCRGFGVRRCRLLILPQLSSPATAGWLKPRILLPEVCEQFNDSSQLADALYHELIHVARRDYLWAAVSDLVRCLLFFHPTVWRARQHMRVQRELACDVAVVSGRPEHRADYAQSLTRFARLRMLQPGGSMGIDFAASASILSMRVRAVLSYRPQRSWWRTGLRSAFSVALLVSFGLLWPMFGIAAEFAAVPQFGPASQTAHLAPLPRQLTTSRSSSRSHRPAKRGMVVPSSVVSQSPQLLVLPPPAAKQPTPPAMIAMSSSEFGPQSNDFDPVVSAPVNDDAAPDWSNTRPVSRSHISVTRVVQGVATGLAQIGREEMGRDGHSHNGH